MFTVTCGYSLWFQKHIGGSRGPQGSHPARKRMQTGGVRHGKSARPWGCSPSPSRVCGIPLAAQSRLGPRSTSVYHRFLQTLLHFSGVTGGWPWKGPGGQRGSGPARPHRSPIHDASEQPLVVRGAALGEAACGVRPWEQVFLLRSMLRGVFTTLSAREPLQADTVTCRSDSLSQSPSLWGGWGEYCPLWRRPQPWGWLCVSPGRASWALLEERPRQRGQWWNSGCKLSTFLQ